MIEWLRKQQLDFLIYILGWSGVVISFIIISLPPTPCLFFNATGLYCSGCGGTRALTSLLHGHFLSALKSNFLAVIFAVYCFIFMSAYTLHILTCKKTPHIHFRLWHIYAGALVILIQFIYSNLII